ncbi:MAG: hypothetical protein MI861_03240, partial [Pirellulales bacterium]|nr:hypothetical protein [Pirellulales bacterium]
MKARLQLTDNASQVGSVASVECQCAAKLFRQHGALWLENALSRSLVAELQSAYLDSYASLSRTKLRRRYAAVGDDRFMITVKVKPPFNSSDLLANPRLLSIVKELLGDDCIISSFGSVVAFPGAEAQTIHFDYPPLFESESLCAGLPPYAVTLVVPLIDLDA